MNTEQKAKEYLKRSYGHQWNQTHKVMVQNLPKLLSEFSEQVLTDYQNQKQVDGVDLEEPELINPNNESVELHEKWNKHQSTLTNKQKIEDHPKKVEEIEKLVRTVGEWSALAIDRKQDLDEATARIKELEEVVEFVSRIKIQLKTRPDLLIAITKAREILS